MERLTEKAWRNLDPWECCGQDKYCKRDCHEDGGCAKGCVVPKLYGKLAAYEDTGLEPADAIEELLAKVPKWVSVEERLPKKKVGDEGYVGYLVLSDGEYQIADFTHDKYMQTAYEFHVDGEYDPNVTHWMELPPEEVE